MVKGLGTPGDGEHSSEAGVPAGRAPCVEDLGRGGFDDALSLFEKTQFVGPKESGPFLVRALKATCYFFKTKGRRVTGLKMISFVD